MIFHGTVRTAFETAAFCWANDPKQTSAQDPQNSNLRRSAYEGAWVFEVGLAADLR